MATTRVFEIKVGGINQLKTLEELLGQTDDNLGDLLKTRNELQQAFQQADYGTPEFQALNDELLEVKKNVKDVRSGFAALDIDELIASTANNIEELKDRRKALGIAFSRADIGTPRFEELQAELEATKNQIKGLQSAANEVDIDELLAGTANNLDELRQRRDALEDAFATADFGTPQFVALQQELANTESRIINLEDAASDITIAESIEGAFIRPLNAVRAGFDTAAQGAELLGGSIAGISVEQLDQINKTLNVIFGVFDTAVLAAEALGKENRFLSRTFLRLGINTNTQTKATEKNTKAKKDNAKAATTEEKAEENLSKAKKDSAINEELNTDAKQKSAKSSKSAAKGTSTFGKALKGLGGATILGVLLLIIDNWQLIEEKISFATDAVRNFLSFITGGLINDASTARSVRNIDKQLKELEKLAAVLEEINSELELQAARIETSGKGALEVLEAQVEAADKLAKSYQRQSEELLKQAEQVSINFDSADKLVKLQVRRESIDKRIANLRKSRTAENSKQINQQIKTLKGEQRLLRLNQNGLLISDKFSKLRDSEVKRVAEALKIARERGIEDTKQLERVTQLAILRERDQEAAEGVAKAQEQSNQAEAQSLQLQRQITQERLRQTSAIEQFQRQNILADNQIATQAAQQAAQQAKNVSQLQGAIDNYRLGLEQAFTVQNRAQLEALQTQRAIEGQNSLLDQQIAKLEKDYSDFLAGVGSDAARINREVDALFKANLDRLAKVGQQAVKVFSNLADLRAQIAIQRLTNDIAKLNEQIANTSSITLKLELIQRLAENQARIDKLEFERQRAAIISNTKNQTEAALRIEKLRLQFDDRRFKSSLAFDAQRKKAIDSNTKQRIEANNKILQARLMDLDKIAQKERTTIQEQINLENQASTLRINSINQEKAARLKSLRDIAIANGTAIDPAEIAKIEADAQAKIREENKRTSDAIRQLQSKLTNFIKGQIDERQDLQLSALEELLNNENAVFDKLSRNELELLDLRVDLTKKGISQNIQLRKAANERIRQIEIQRLNDEFDEQTKNIAKGSIAFAVAEQNRRIKEGIINDRFRKQQSDLDGQLFDERLKKAQSFVQGFEQITGNLFQISSTLLEQRISIENAILEARRQAIEAEISAISDRLSEVDNQIQSSTDQIQNLEQAVAEATGSRRQELIRRIEAQSKATNDLRKNRRSLEQQEKNLANQRDLAAKQQEANEKRIAEAQERSANTARIAAVAQSGLATARVFAGIASSPANTLNPASLFAATIAATAFVAQLVEALGAFGFYDGGYTGNGIGQPDGTGAKVAGIVHQNEWVAPAWMTQDKRLGYVIQMLEAERMGKRTFQDGGFTTTQTTPSVEIQNLSTNPLTANQIAQELRRNPPVISVKEFTDVQTKSVQADENSSI